MNKNQTIIYLFLAVSYLILLQFLPFTAYWILKSLPAIFLLSIAATHLAGRHRLMVCAALTLCATGDIAIEFSFTAGLTAFLLAQLFYMASFAQQYAGFLRRWPASIVLLVGFIVMFWLIQPNLGELFIPVLAYNIAIGSMGFAAIFSRLPLWPGVCGALIFILSDSLIAIDRFLTPLPLRSLLIMGSYYLALYLLINGFLKTPEKR